MTILPLMLAVALSAGNAEFEKSAANGAAEIAVGRIAAELSSKGPAAGGLRKAMLGDPKRFAARAEAEKTCREIYAAELEEEFRARAKAVGERLGLGAELERIVRLFDCSDCSTARLNGDKLFEAAFAKERSEACAEQAKGIAGAVKPSEQEFETKDEQALRAEMTGKVAAQQKGGVFEENLGYISTTIVDPVIDSAKKEMKRQREYLTRTKCEAYAPSVLTREIEANLRKNVEERKAKEGDPSKQWGVFPRTLADALPAAVERRTLERVAKNADDVAIKVDAESIQGTIASDPAAHRRADESEKAFRGVFAGAVLDGALGRAVEEAPSKERDEFAAYVRAHAASPEIVRAVEARVRRELLPELKKVRGEIAQADLVRGWPTLADGTWYPDAELADAVAARSDYQKAVAHWRKIAELSDLSLAGAKAVRLEETDALADRAVAEAFGRARNAIAAQNAILTAAEPEVLGAAKDRKASFWRTTPDFRKIVEMLTEAVEGKWDEVRVGTLWPDEETRPANAADQHAALFPSVRKRIELIAKSILEEMEKPEVKPEQKPEPEKPQEDASDSDRQSDEQTTVFSIVVEREGDQVTVKLEQGKSTVAERSAKARMSDYQGAMKYVSDKLGTEILKLK